MVLEGNTFDNISMEKRLTLEGPFQDEWIKKMRCGVTIVPRVRDPTNSLSCSSKNVGFSLNRTLFISSIAFILVTFYPRR